MDKSADLKQKECIGKMRELIREIDEALNECDNSAASEYYKNGYEALKNIIQKM